MANNNLFDELNEQLKQTLMLEKEFKDEVLSAELTRLLDIRDYVDKRIQEVQKEKTDLLDSTLKNLEALKKEE